MDFLCVKDGYIELVKNKMESLLNAVFPMTEFLLLTTHHWAGVSGGRLEAAWKCLTSATHKAFYCRHKQASRPGVVRGLADL